MVMNKEVISYVGNNRTQYNSVSTGCLRCPRMDSFKELFKALAERIDKSETRERGRTAEAKQNLLTSVHHLVSQLWKGTQIHEGYEAGINKRSGWYSGTTRYRQVGLTYPQTIAAYVGLQRLHLIKETKAGYLDREKHQCSITKFVATDELKEMFSELNEDPFMVLMPDLNAECIILRDEVEGRR